ncbi:MAG: ImmA/IrrE family metallo-endopeptidase, partial [Gammaproteobacteria bacterium]
HDVKQWRAGKHPTLNQLLKTAKSAYIPFDYLLGDTPPPPAKVPLPDLRDLKSKTVAQPSLELLATIHQCQWRQEWYKEYWQRHSSMDCAFVGSASVSDAAPAVAESMRATLAVPLIPLKGTWENRVTTLMDAAEAVGILTMRNSMVNSNTDRPLNPTEFRSFSLVDKQAPLVFINGADSPSAQAFTLAHALAHLWLGNTALSGSKRLGEQTHKVEQWCTEVAAEFLVPQSRFEGEIHNLANLDSEVSRLSKLFKVSSLVILIRLKASHLISQARFRQSYDRAANNSQDPHSNTKVQLNNETQVSRQVRKASRLLVQAVVPSVQAGEVTFTEAYDLLGVRSVKSLKQMGELVGVAL